RNQFAGENGVRYQLSRHEARSRRWCVLKRHVDGKDRSPPRPRANFNIVAKELGQPADDGKPKPQATPRPAPLLDLNELPENLSLLIGCYAAAGIPNSTRTRSPRLRQPIRTRPRSVYLMALDTRLRRMRPSSCGSVRVASRVGTTLKRRFFCA